jgi:hypothetical protein
MLSPGSLPVLVVMVMGPVHRRDGVPHIAGTGQQRWPESAIGTGPARGDTVGP